MELEQLRLLASPLRHLLSERRYTVTHNQALELLAAAAGLRSWSEVRAFPESVASRSFDAQAAARLTKRIQSKGGPEIAQESLLDLFKAAKGTTSSLPAVWPEGPPAGIYVVDDEDATHLAIQRYVEGSGDALFFTNGVYSSEGNAIELGDSGIFSAGLARTPPGTLLVMTLAIGRDPWEDLKSRMTAAWNAADAGLRVIVVCSTPTPQTLLSDVSLLTHTQGEPGPGETNWLVGVVSDKGELRAQTPFVPVRRMASPIIELPPSKLRLPDAVSTLLRQALVARRTGLLVAGMLADAGENFPLEVIAAMLPLLQALGPIGRIPRQNGYDGPHPVPEGVAILPTYSSVESALAAGCAVVVFDMAFHSECQEIAAGIDRGLFVVGVKALGVGRGVSTVVSSMHDVENVHDFVTAAVCTGKVRGRDSKPMTWDMYVRVETLAEANAKRKRPLEFEEMFDAARVVRREDQISQLIADGIVTEKSVAKDYPYLKIPKRPSKNGST